MSVTYQPYWHCLLMSLAETIAAIIVNARNTGHVHGSVSPKMVADAYPDEWPKVLALVGLVIERDVEVGRLRSRLTLANALAEAVDAHLRALRTPFDCTHSDYPIKPADTIAALDQALAAFRGDT